MSFIWHFFTGGRPINPVGRQCHVGPMIDLEVVMSQSFTYMVPFNTLRKRLLDNIVGTDRVAVQTRETILRAINTSLGPMFVRLAPQKKELQVLICEKKNSNVIEDSLQDLNPFYLDAVNQFFDYGFPRQQIDLIEAALESNSPVLRVAGKCAVILIASFYELDNQNA